VAFRKPVFNIFCNIWRAVDFRAGAAPVGMPALGMVPCNLQFGRKEGLESDRMAMWLLLEPGTDIRDPWGVANRQEGQADAVEVPAGSGRFYTVVYVDDVASGFPTQYRTALIVKGGIFGNKTGYVDPVPWPNPSPILPVPNPGVDCNSAGTFALNQVVPGQLNGPAPINDWWAFFAVAGQAYSVRVNGHVVTSAATIVYEGSCAALVQIGNAIAYPAVIPIVPTITGFCKVELVCPIIPPGPDPYTIQVTSP